ncbi:hypothetical protein [Fulvimarina sp. MAC8]|uniref:hypothetical protein n=1 Tax=Fulvimarina sp. MAC8 TaxID=3162874 RepID=UPI0032EE18AF
MNFFKKKYKSRTSKDDGHIIITGTGRSGTTLLVQYFTYLGFDTGYSLRQVSTDVDPISHAGLERPLIDEGNPYVIKSPWFAETLSEALANNRIRIHAAILPMRDLFQAAESRRHITRSGTDAGGLWLTDKPEEQEAILAGQFYKALYPLIEHGIQVYLIHFPRFVSEPDTLYDSMKRLHAEHGVSREESQRALIKVARLDRIHSFTPSIE